jgi:hypothetical protein
MKKKISRCVCHESFLFVYLTGSTRIILRKKHRVRHSLSSGHAGEKSGKSTKAHVIGTWLLFLLLRLLPDCYCALI